MGTLTPVQQIIICNFASTGSLGLAGKTRGAFATVFSDDLKAQQELAGTMRSLPRFPGQAT